MGRLAFVLIVLLVQSAEPVGPANPSTPTRRPVVRAEPEAGGRGWFRQPQSVVVLALVSIVAIGGGRQVVRRARARRALARLGSVDVKPDEIRSAADHGRDGLLDLFRLLDSAPDQARRDAAGQALARLWKADDLIAEEEKALVRRGYAVTWTARRRYPRGLRVPIPIEVSFGVPFLREGPGEIGPNDLAWRTRIVGTERASLEELSGWRAGPGLARFTINPTDFATNGPHRLVLRATVKAARPSGAWEIELPHIPFTFELDPSLRVDALLGLEDGRAEILSHAVRLVASGSGDGPARFVPLGDDLLLRDPPALTVTTPLPSDIAHAISLEFDGIAGRISAGSLVVGGGGGASPVGRQIRPLESIGPIDPGLEVRPGEHRMRAILAADPDLGWADPEVRSIWPGTIVTDWAEVRIVRR